MSLGRLLFLKPERIFEKIAVNDLGVFPASLMAWDDSLVVRTAEAIYRFRDQ